MRFVQSADIRPYDVCDRPKCDSLRANNIELDQSRQLAPTLIVAPPAFALSVPMSLCAIDPGPRPVFGSGSAKAVAETR